MEVLELRRGQGRGREGTCILIWQPVPVATFMDDDWELETRLEAGARAVVAAGRAADARVVSLQFAELNNAASASSSVHKGEDDHWDVPPASAAPELEPPAPLPMAMVVHDEDGDGLELLEDSLRLTASRLRGVGADNDDNFSDLGGGEEEEEGEEEHEGEEEEEEEEEGTDGASPLSPGALRFRSNPPSLVSATVGGGGKGAAGAEPLANGDEWATARAGGIELQARSLRSHYTPTELRRAVEEAAAEVEHRARQQQVCVQKEPRSNHIKRSWNTRGARRTLLRS